MASRVVKSIGWLVQDLSEGTSPLLNKREKELVEDIYYEAENNSEKDYFDAFDNLDDIRQKIEILEENLEHIIQHFRFYRDARKEFVQKYPVWRRARWQTIEALQSIGTSLHTDRRKCNISRLIGNCTSFVGGTLFVYEIFICT